MTSTTDELNEIVRGPWSSWDGENPTRFECGIHTGAPEYRILKYTVQIDRRNAEVDVYRARVQVKSGRFNLHVDGYGDTPVESLEDLIGQCRGYLEELVGTIHPEELGNQCLDLRPVSTSDMATDEDGVIDINQHFDYPWCVLVVDSRVAPVFTAQTGGVMCNHPTVQGNLVDLGGRCMPELREPRGSYQEEVERIVGSIEEPLVREMLEPREHGFNEEAWIAVHIPEDSEIASEWMRGKNARLIYPNSD